MFLSSDLLHPPLSENSLLHPSWERIKSVTQACHPSIPMMWVLREIAIATGIIPAFCYSSTQLLFPDPWSSKNKQKRWIVCCTNYHPNSIIFCLSKSLISILSPSPVTLSYFRLLPSPSWIIQEPLINWSSPILHIRIMGLLCNPKT